MVKTYDNVKIGAPNTDNQQPTPEIRAQKGKQPARQPTRTRKATHKLGGVSIDLLKKANKCKREDDDDRKLFDEIQDIADTQSPEEGATTTPAHVDATTAEVELGSNSNAVIKSVKKAVSKAEIAGTSSNPETK